MSGLGQIAYPTLECANLPHFVNRQIRLRLLTKFVNLAMTWPVRLENDGSSRVYVGLLEIGAKAAMRNLTKNFRIRAAILIALAYAFCVLAPSAAVAASPTSLHCLDELSGMSAPSKHEDLSHAHADGTIHHHDHSGVPDHHSGTDGKADDGSCCGLFGVSALAHDPGLTFGVSALASQTVSAASDGRDGRAPAPLHRPPIA